MSAATHLDERERQGAADGTLDASRALAVAAHLATCAECAADVARLRSLVSLVREEPMAVTTEEDLWPSIRLRIEAAKVVRLGAADGGARPVRRRRGIGIAATIVAAALLLAALAQMQRVRVPPAAPAASAATQLDAAFASVADSSRAFEEESNALLNELEMRRAMLRPHASVALDSDLAVIDRSIDELKAAIARDPKNLALQRLLAASYREKVDLLRRANNAG